MYKLIEIDDLTRPDHSFLTEDDSCFYFHDYTTNHKGAFTTGNSLILNFKKKPDRRDKPEWKYKIKAIEEVANLLISCNFRPEHTIVPIPPSKTENHKLYDDRILEALKIYSRCGNVAKINTLLSFRKSTLASHESLIRPSPDEIYNNIILNHEALNGVSNEIIIFDDLLTTGAHFKACQRALLEFLPACRIKGLFIARRAINRDDDFSLF